MKNFLCSRCKKRMAIVFISRQENGKNLSDGLCIQCARELKIPGIDEAISSIGIDDTDIENMSELMGDFINDEVFSEEATEKAMPFIHKMMDTVRNIIPESGFGSSEGDSEEPSSTSIVPDDTESTENGADEGQSKSIATTRTSDNERGSTAKKKRKKLKYLDSFCTNLNDKFIEGSIDPVIGRSKEISRVIQILCRRIKNNPCLIGDPGVGKTAIAEGIAQRIVEGNVPRRLLDKEIFLLDMTSLVAGTQFRGQFESRIKSLLEDVKTAGNAILFIDEIHTIVGAGDSMGSMNAANILKPSLSRGEIQVIGATTFDEYRENIEKDAALERRFQTVKVVEPTIDDSVKILQGIKDYYENFHRVSISDDIIRQTVVLAERYVNDRFLPDKAIDLLDEACTCAALSNTALEEYDKKINEKKKLEIAQSELGDSENYAMAAEYKTNIARLENELEELKPKALGAPVTERNIAEVIELWTNIPASKIEQGENRKLAELSDTLKQRIVGQDDAITQITGAVKRARLRLHSNKKRPASFIFVGPTGVGKTQLVKDLSQKLFDSTEPLIRLDMSEFLEKHTVSRIIGSPPGYVGFNEAGQLTEKVRRRPYSIVLFDEIEKAHPDVLNILLQIMDEGHITDAQGRDISFENTIIIMTSNAGSEKQGLAIGFDRELAKVSKEKAMDALRQIMRPEFLARVDEVIVFSPLSVEDYIKISRIAVDDLKESLKEHDIMFDCSESAVEHIAKTAFGNKNGARDIHKQIRAMIEDPMCNIILENSSISLVKAELESDNIVLHTS